MAIPTVCPAERIAGRSGRNVYIALDRNQRKTVDFQFPRTGIGPLDGKSIYADSKRRPRHGNDGALSGKRFHLGCNRLIVERKTECTVRGKRYGLELERTHLDRRTGVKLKVDAYRVICRVKRPFHVFPVVDRRQIGISATGKFKRHIIGDADLPVILLSAAVTKRIEHLFARKRTIPHRDLLIPSAETE